MTDRRLRGATTQQLERATAALFDIRQRHLSEFPEEADTREP
jgi:hypothetical protein